MGSTETAKPAVTKALAPIDEVRGSILKMETQFKMVLPPHVPVEKFMRVLITAVQSEPKLIECNRSSLYAAAMNCAKDGLIPDRKEAVILPFNTRDQGMIAQYLPMVRGILKLVRNSGELATITAHVVYENDEFEYALGDDEHVVHKPLLTGDRGKHKITYAIAKTKDGAVYREFMTEEQIQAVRKVSRAKDSGPWSGDFADEMRKKTVIRRLSKRLPMSTDLEQVIERDDELYNFNERVEKAQGTDAPTEKKKAGRKSRLNTIIDQNGGDNVQADAPVETETGGSDATPI